MARSDAPERPATAAEYDDLLTIGVAATLRGVKNSYLVTRLSREHGGSFQVSGPEETLEACPCCNFRSLPRRGEYDICPVCFWEDDGSNEPDLHSGPNHMTLRAARDNFERIGAMSEADLPKVVKDAKDRYDRG